MDLGRFFTPAERMGWNSFCERLGASVRARTLLRVLDDCRANPQLSKACEEGTRRLLNEELTIAVTARDRKALPA